MTLLFQLVSLCLLSMAAEAAVDGEPAEELADCPMQWEPPPNSLGTWEGVPAFVKVVNAGIGRGFESRGQRYVSLIWFAPRKDRPVGPFPPHAAHHDYVGKYRMVPEDAVVGGLGEVYQLHRVMVTKVPAEDRSGAERLTDPELRKRFAPSKDRYVFGVLSPLEPNELSGQLRGYYLAVAEIKPVTSDGKMSWHAHVGTLPIEGRIDDYHKEIERRKTETKWRWVKEGEAVTFGPHQHRLARISPAQTVEHAKLGPLQLLGWIELDSESLGDGPLKFGTKRDKSTSPQYK